MAILDSITANLAYGFRLLKTGVTYACRVKNTTTNVETDLAPGFSKATADALVSAGQELVVIKFYDQTGSGNHLDSVGSNHGKLKFDVLEVPYLEKTSSYPDIRLRTASNLTFTSPKFFSLVYFTDNTDGWFTCMSNTVAFISRINSGNLAFYNGNGVVFGSLSTGNWHQITSYFQSGADKAFVNGTERTATSGSDAGDTAQTAKLVCLRQDNDANGAVQGRWREIIYIEGTVSDVNRAAIEADQTASLTPPDTTAPAAITDLTYDSKNSTSITGHFTAPTDASGIGGYEIRVNGGSWTPLTVTGTTTKSFTKTGLAPGTSHTLEVRSYDGAPTPNYSAASNSITQTTWQTGPTITETSPLQTAELGVPYNNPISFSDGDGTVTITVKSGYSLPSGFSIVGNALVNSNPSSLVTNHATRFIATDSKGQTDEKDFNISVVDTTVPTKVTGVVADVISVTQIDVDSDAASDASGIDYYQTRIADNEGMSVNVHVYDHDSTAYSITSNLNPANNKSYWVQQRAIDNNGLVGAWSDAVEVPMTVPVSIPTSSPITSLAVGDTASGSFAHAGGSGAGSFAVHSGTFPTGLNLASNGARSGSPTTEGTFNFTLRYIDADDPDNYVDKSFVWVIVPEPPEFVNDATLDWAQTDHEYEAQLEVQGGSGAGSFSVTEGNLPEGALDAETGLITIADVGDVDYVFTVLYEDENGSEVEKEFTIPVSPYAFWKTSWVYKRPLQIKYLKAQRIFEPIQGDDEVIEDKPQKRQFTLQILWQGSAMDAEIQDFLYEHRLRQPFMFKPECGSDYIQVKIIGEVDEAQMLNYGGFDLVFREV